MNRILYCFLLSAAISGGSLRAQIRGDSLKEVEVRSGMDLPPEGKAAFAPGAKTVSIDSAVLDLYRQQSVATLLSQASSVFIKSYGFNSLATLSFRGASAAQSAVYWEGVPLMNGATGISDVSLIPVSFSDSISVQYGSGGALGGSGNVGGALLLQSSRPVFGLAGRWRGGVGAGCGSFGQWPASAEIAYNSGRLALRARGVYNRASNNFRAEDEFGRQFNTPNAAQEGGGVLIDAYFRADKRNTLALHAWQQSYRREIPPALFESVSRKAQSDDALRLLADWRRAGIRMQQYAKVALMEDRYQYEDPAIGLQSTATTRQLFAEWGLGGTAGRETSWLVFIPLQYMDLVNNTSSGTQSRFAIAANVKRMFLSQRLAVALNGRGERFDEGWVGLPGAGAELHLAGGFRLRTSLQRSYRMPTLNELHYDPGGNKDLKPETGWSFEGGYTYSKAITNNIVINHNMSAYHRAIRDWIIWLGGAIWTPHNLAAVRSRGLETENEIMGRSGVVQWRLLVAAAYARSTPTESYLANDNSIGRQIPYTPRLTGSGMASAGWRAMSLSYVQSYAGKRYITSDESAALPAYSTGNLHAGYMLRRAGNSLQFRASVQNIWNSRYAVVAFRPMPGINFLFSMALSRD